MVRGPGPVHCEFFLYLINVYVFVKQHKLVDLVQYIVLVELKVFFLFLLARNLSLPKARNIVIRHCPMYSDRKSVSVR